MARKLRGTDQADFIDLSLLSGFANVDGLGGDDTLIGDAANNILRGQDGDDTLNGEAGDDTLRGGNDNDTLTGGADSDKVFGDGGNDLGIYVAADNVGASDSYDGGKGFDTLRLDLTLAEWQDPVFQADLNEYLQFISDIIHPKKGEAGKATFEFDAFDLQATGWEGVQIFVDGVEVTVDIDAFLGGRGTSNQVLINQGTAPSGTAGDLNLGITPEGGANDTRSLKLGDLDGDGDLDAFLGNDEQGSVPSQVLINQGGAQGGIEGDFDLGITPEGGANKTISVALGDLDGDGVAPAVDANGLPNIDPLGLLPDIYVDVII